MSRGLIGAVGVWLVVLASLTAVRAEVWTSDLTLWTDAVKGSPNKPRPFINVGLAREQAGDLEGALMAYQTAITLSAQPRLTVYQQRFTRLASEINIARILAQTGHEDAAEALLDAVIARSPLFPHARWNRAILYARTGRCQQGIPDAAIAAQLDASFSQLVCQ